MKKQNDPRHFARWHALQTLFSKNFPSNQDSQLYESQELLEINSIHNYNEELMQKIVDGVENNIEKMNKIIQTLAPERPLVDIAKVDLFILYIAITEGFILKITPEKVAIDEAIELAKEFGGEASKQFINGVLGNFLKQKDQFKF